MPVDPYALCPCGSGKKLKFCCSDLVAEIEKVQSMVAGGQPHAALKHLDQLLSKQPRRVSLLELKATLELSVEELGAAAETIGLLLQVQPEGATAHAHQAILAAATQGGLAAVPPLQDAFERLGDNMPRRVFEALGAVGQALLGEGNLIAARRHLLMYAQLAPEDDTKALELLLRMNMQSGLPLLIRDQQNLIELPAEDSGEPIRWRAEFEEACGLARRGLWRRAEGLFNQMLEQQGPRPAIVYNLALVRGWQGKADQFAKGLHAYASLDVCRDDAADAEALAQLVDPSLEEPQLETVRMVFDLTDAEALAEQFAIDRQVVHYQLPDDQPDRSGQNGAGQDGKATGQPRHTYVLLDRPLPATGVGLELEEVPLVVGFLAIYGKRTDREAQLEISTDRGDRFDKVQQILSPLAGPWLGGRFPDHPVEEEVVALKSLGEDALSWRWRLPDDTPAEHCQELQIQQRRAAILDAWPGTDRAALGGLSPMEACQDTTLRIPLLASVLLVEQAIADLEERPLLDELREKLKLPAPETIDAAGIDSLKIPMVRVPRLDVASMPDDVLAQLLDRAIMVGAAIAVLIVAAELVSRDEVAEDVDLANAYRQLIRVTANLRQALQWVQRARDWSRQHGTSEAEWAVQELELSLELGDAARMQQVINEIRDKHLEIPGVAESVYRLLSEAGLLPPASAGPRVPGSKPVPSGQAGRSPGVRSAVAADSKEPAIWTPGQRPQVPKGAAGGVQKGKSRGKPELWTP